MTEIEGFILAGGASRRMGRDKAMLRLAEKTFVEYAANALDKVSGGQISVVGNLSSDSVPVRFSARETRRLPVIGDLHVENSPAALIGLHSALARTERKWAAILACDLPFATTDLFERLAAPTAGDDYDAIVPLQTDGRAQPLCAVYRRAACLSAVEEMLRGEDRRLQNFLARTNALFVEFERLKDLPNSEVFFLNINTPEDFLAAQKTIEVKKFVSSRQ